MAALLKVQGLSKKYSRDLKASVGFAARDLLRGIVGVSDDKPKLRKTEFWALKDVNFELCRGEVLAILGHNGAGKSTLLKCIAGKLHVDSGSVTRKGEIGYLLEMSAGFSPTMTGRDNVSVRGRLMGKRGKSLDSYISQVEEFAGIGEFFDAPVQFYSSGMKSRLGFAASSVMEPDILIIDEVLAVGDLAFRLQCYERINEMARKAAVIFVSHSTGQVARLCDRGIYLDKGRVLFNGGVQEAISLYQDQLGVKSENKQGHSLNPELVSFTVIADGAIWSKENSIAYGSLLSLDIDVSKLQPHSQIRVVLKDVSQSVIADWNSARTQLDWPDVKKSLRSELGPVELAPGYYSLFLQIMSPDGVEHLCFSESVSFRVSGDYLYANAIQRNARWSFT